MDRSRAAAKQAAAMQQLAEQLPAITTRLEAIEQQLAAPVAIEAGAELVATEPPATAAQVTDLADRLTAIEQQLGEIKTLLAQRTAQPQQSQRR
jgi:hypothetical protein